MLKQSTAPVNWAWKLVDRKKVGLFCLSVCINGQGQSCSNVELTATD